MPPSCWSTGASGALDHRQVRELPDLLQSGDLLVLNETRVIPARLRLRRSTGGSAEVLLLEPWDADRRTWEALVRPGGKLAVGEILEVEGVPLVRMGERTPAGDTFWVELVGDDDPVVAARPPRRDAAAAVHLRAVGRPRALSDGVLARARLGGRPDRGPALHARSSSSAWRSAASPRRRSNWWSDSTPSSRSAPRTRSIIRCTPSGTACPRRPRQRAGRPSGSSPSVPPRCARWSRPPGRANRPDGPTCSSIVASTGGWSTRW